MVAFEEFAIEDFQAERVEDFALDNSLQRAGSVGGVVAFLGEEFPGGIIESQRQVLFLQAGQEGLELGIHNARDLGGIEPGEDNDLINAVQELGTEMAALMR